MKCTYCHQVQPTPTPCFRCPSAERQSESAEPRLEAVCVERFALVTGDVDTAREILPAMRTLSERTGVDLSDVMSAASDVANQIGDVTNRAESIESVMRKVCWSPKVEHNGHGTYTLSWRDVRDLF